MDMTWTGVEMCDGTAHKAEITQALMQYIDTGEKRQALITSYGDLGVLLKKMHSNNGASRGEWFIMGMNQGLVMEKTKERYKCRITWNKAAKLIQMECKRVAGK
jgi:hypothetical protein